MQDTGYATPMKGSPNTPPWGRDPQVENHCSKAFYQNQNRNQQTKRYKCSKRHAGVQSHVITIYYFRGTVVAGKGV